MTDNPTNKNRPFKSTPYIREHFIRHPGVVIWLHELRDIAAAHGEGHLTDVQLRGIVNTTKWMGIEIFSVLRGQSWMYRPGAGNPIGSAVYASTTGREMTEPKTEPISVINTIAQNLSDKVDVVTKMVTERLYREKMVTKSGDRVLEDEDGVLFRARELDLE